MYNNVMNMNGNFKPFRVWCQHVLPSVYDDSLSYMELLNKVVDYINQFGEYLDEFSALNSIKYEGLWDITKQYPAWSVVSVDGERGFISVQAVPAGISIENTEYWRLIADFTAEIAGLAERVVALEAEDVVLSGRITTVDGRVTTVDGRVTEVNNRVTSEVATLDGKIATANGRIDTANTNITNLQTQINQLKKWSNRKVLWVGDSYGNGWNGSASLSTKPYQYASQLLGCQYVDISHGGTRFGNNETSAEYKYLTYIQEYVTNHSDMDSFTDVIIIGGANEITFNPSSDLSSAITTCVNYVKANFPNAKIRIGMVARMAQTGSANATYGNMMNIRDQYEHGAINNGVEYIAKSELINHNYSLLASDGIHLTSYVDMGYKLAQLLMNGDFDSKTSLAVAKEHITVNTNDDRVPTTVNCEQTLMIDKTINFDCTDLMFQFSSPVSMVWRKAYKFARISGNTNSRNLFCGTYKSVKQHLTGLVNYRYNNVDYWEVQPFCIYLYDNYLWISWEGVLAHGGVTMNECKEIGIRTGFQFLLNSETC